MIAFARFSDHVKGGNLGSLPDEYDLVVKGMALVGTLVGQVRPRPAVAFTDGLCSSEHEMLDAPCTAHSAQDWTTGHGMHM